MLPNMRITNAMAPATHPRQPSAQNMPYSGHKFCLVSGGRRVHCSQRRAHAVPVTTKKNTRIPVVQKLMSSNSSSGRWADATHNRCQELLMMELYRRGNTDSLFYFGISLAGRPWMAAAAGCGRPAAAGRCHRCRPWEEAAFKVQTLCISSNSYCFAVLKMLGTAGKIHIFFSG